MVLDDLRRSLVAALVHVLALGCGGAQPDVHEPPTPVHPLAECPARFSDAQAFEGGRYGARGGRRRDVSFAEDELLACPYPEGRCGYARVSRAGGCSECWSSHLVWRCHSDTVPRLDGCPYAAPAEGSACDADRTCGYSDGSSVLGATCTGGVWRRERHELHDPV